MLILIQPVLNAKGDHGAMHIFMINAHMAKIPNILQKHPLIETKCVQKVLTKWISDELELTFPEFHFEIEAKVDFPSACI